MVPTVHLTKPHETSPPPLRFYLASHRITKPNLRSRQEQLHEPSSNLPNIRIMLRLSRVERARRSRVPKPKLDRIPMNEVLGRIRKVAGVRVIIARPRSGIQVRSGDHGIGAPGSGAHGAADTCCGFDVVGVLACWAVLAVSAVGAGSVAQDASNAVVCGVEEIHGRGLGLVFVAAPAVQDVSSVRVEIDEPTDAAKGIHDPFDAFRLGFRKRCCT
jgi:hypothetical protein